MDRAAAIAKLHEWVESPSLRRHCETVEHVMRRAAPHYDGPNANEEQWALAGLLHDADYEKFAEDHPRRIVAWVREQGEEEIAHAIECHAPFLNVPFISQLDKALFACDELTGFIVAVALMRPDGVMTLESSSVMKKLKDKKFAAGVKRDEVAQGAELLQVDLPTHIDFIVAALRERSGEFGLKGKT
jgi:predicted hydrolase (HD superfamily)